jgi:hypothetical protein
MQSFLEPGVIVRHPGQDAWGDGQVQSVIGRKVTVNFENAGKHVIDTDVVRLKLVGEDPRPTP